jgi:hypothetical protein
MHVQKVQDTDVQGDLVEWEACFRALVRKPKDHIRSI